MIKYAKAFFVLMLMAVICCGGVSASIVEDLNVTYQLDGTYINADAVAPITGGGFFLGMTNSSSAVLLKTDNAGKEIWRTYLTGESVRSVVTLDDGGCVLTTITRVIEGTPEEGYTFSGETTLIRVDSKGTVLWESPLADTGAGGIAVSGGKIYFAGWFWETNTGFTQSFLLSNGAPGNDQIRLGNETSPMIPLAMLLEDDGTLVLTGGTTSYLTEGSAYAWIAKVKGGIVQNEAIVRTGSADPLYGEGACGYDLTRAHDGGYLVVGSNPPFGVTWESGLGWAAHVKEDLSLAWVNELPGCYIPYAVVQFGDGYLAAGMDGYDDPVWLTLSLGGAITDLQKISQNGKTSKFNDAASVSTGKAALVGWIMPESSSKGILITLVDTEVPAESDNTGLLVAGGVICVIIIAGLVYFLVIRKPAAKPEKKSAKKSGKKN
ncbi:hypothetical protein McpSp1_14200 [Methanocorpusculaceae archaeon Sp1]|uniref:Uncharacterized protein n=1 Tax=Methanorbis furvi TaxID=3028299 RepID=A0AAE4S9Y2_9EURY|nr:hypothetical protein [Methanocorpusculaceae archaeon Sp1]MDV0441409.1 hypothetical protein [Methanocorpusculaceae archaeon Ag1]